MDGIIEVAAFLTEHPLIAALVELGTLGLVLYIGKHAMRHDKECAERWGYMKAKLEALEREVGK